MLWTPAIPEIENLTIQLPKNIKLLVTQKYFEILAEANQNLRLERTATGELILNPPTD